MAWCQPYTYTGTSEDFVGTCTSHGVRVPIPLQPYVVLQQSGQLGVPGRVEIPQGCLQVPQSLVGDIRTWGFSFLFMFCTFSKPLCCVGLQICWDKKTNKQDTLALLALKIRQVSRALILMEYLKHEGKFVPIPERKRTVSKTAGIRAHRSKP